MPPLTNEFSWSRSRDATFKECRRRYYFQYYGSWGGWDVGADAETREIYILKQLKSRQMWAGEVVHTCIQRSLENVRTRIEPLPVDEIVSLALDQMRREWKQSQQKIYRSRPKTIGLFEHEYDVPIPNEEWRSNAANAQACLRNFYGSETYRWIRSSSTDEWLDLEDFSHFHLDDTKVHVKLDFALRDGEAVHIYDWKTGRRDEEDNSIQLACYALYATEKWDAPPRSVRTSEFNLARNLVKEYSITEADIERISNYIRGSIRDMKELIKAATINEVEKDSCPLTTETWRCRNCNFKRLCERP